MWVSWVCERRRSPLSDLAAVRFTRAASGTDVRKWLRGAGCSVARGSVNQQVLWRVVVSVCIRG